MRLFGESPSSAATFWMSAGSPTASTVSPYCSSKSGGGGHLDLGPAHPGDLHAEAAREVERGDRLPGGGGPGDDEALGDDGARHPAQVEAALLPHHDPQRVELLARADREQHVPEPEPRLRTRHLQGAVLPDPRDDDPAPRERGHLLEGHADEVRVRDLEVRPGERRRLRGRLRSSSSASFLSDTRNAGAHRHHHQDDAEHAEGVGDRVAEARGAWPPPPGPPGRAAPP